MHLIRRARIAQRLAVRAIAQRGLAHPATRTLLAAAALAAAAAWEAGHHVTDVHPHANKQPGSAVRPPAR
ncbi:hypothetical protein [Streptomyces mirabilis]|uniref:Uncharacterized protein n=1 Tax=Streptomyces mirabilis TaxID=68239 RepID=A0ABU3V4Z8_9ACTN|nr:hypothetical protein [Streptomyces mirabilis]MCX5355605.1 hypothetical protein [Streptomyces mirabilis]MDU9001251.1 hypothetical protein [Streptomyces mirabilis]